MKRAIVAYTAQSMLAHSPYAKFKQLIGSRSPKNYAMAVNDDTNTHTTFVPTYPV